MQIESYRANLEAFELNLQRELYAYYSGLKDRFELTSVYSDYSDLFSAENIREVQAELEKTGTSFPSRSKSLAKILQYLVDQRLDRHTAQLTQDITRFETRQTFMWEGEKLHLFQVPARLRNEIDASKRRKLGELSAAALCEADELRCRKMDQLQTTAANLGFQNYIKARESISGVDYRGLMEGLDAALSRLDDCYTERMRASMGTTLGIPLQEAGSWDLPRWRMLNDRVEIFPSSNLMPVVDCIVTDLGVRPERSGAVSIDLNPKAAWFSGAVCIPVRVPQEIKIAMRPESGARYYAGLLHEMGHACHLAWTDASLPVEHRAWGDRALSESYAFLLERFILEPAWLERMFSFSSSREFLRFQALYRTFLVRRCAGNLHFALRVYSGAPAEDIPYIYSETMMKYTGLRYTQESWAEAFAEGLESADYLRGWVLERLLREHIHTRYGKIPNHSASGFLKEIWETGHLYSANELCREIGIGTLEPQILADELSGGLHL